MVYYSSAIPKLLLTKTKLNLEPEPCVPPPTFAGEDKKLPLIWPSIGTHPGFREAQSSIIPSLDSLFRAKASFKSTDLTQTKIYWRVVENSWMNARCFFWYLIDLAIFPSTTFPVFFYFLRNTNSCSICHIYLIESRNLKIFRRIHCETCEFRLKVKREPSACFLPLWKIIFQQDRKEVLVFYLLWKIFSNQKKTGSEAHLSLLAWNHYFQEIFSFLLTAFGFLLSAFFTKTRPQTLGSDILI